MFRLPIFGQRGGETKRGLQSYSSMTQNKQSRLREATKVDSVCPYCAVGCSTNIYTKNNVVIDIEGNPNSPINEGTLCPKGANTFQLHSNPHKINQVMYRAPYGTEWKPVPLEWAMDRIAEKVKGNARRRLERERTRRGSGSTRC